MKIFNRVVGVFLLTFLAVSCASPSSAVALPPHPLYVIAGQYAVPGFDHGTVSVVDRQTLKPVGSRELKVSFINDALYDGENLWFGYAGDIDVDMHTVARLSPNLADETLYDVCIEPNGIHDDGDAIIVLCTVNGMVAHATRIDKATGRILAETDVVTKWGDMMYVDSILYNGELIVYGGGDYASSTNRTAQELQVRDPKTLQLVRIIKTPETELGMNNFLVGADRLLILNMASRYAKEFGFTPVDILSYRTGDSSTESLPLLERSPHDGVIIGDFLYTLHNTYDNFEGRPVTIYKTNLETWEQHHWTYDGKLYGHLNDMTVVNGRIYITLPRAEDTTREGLYEFDPTTGALTLITAIPGASLIVDSHPQG